MKNKNSSLGYTPNEQPIVSQFREKIFFYFRCIGFLCWSKMSVQIWTKAKSPNPSTKYRYRSMPLHICIYIYIYVCAHDRGNIT